MANPYKDIMKLIKETEKAKTLGEQFLADLNRYIQVSKVNTMPSKTIKPSSLGGCFREQCFILWGQEPDPGKMEKAEDITIQQSGNDRHNRLQNSCQDAVNFNIPIEWIDPEEAVKRAQYMGINTTIKRRDGNELLCHNADYRSNFKCDGIIKYNSKLMILEIKTEEYGKFNCRVTPEAKHEYQAILYSLCFGIDDIMFLYEDRNLTFRKAYHIVVTEARKQEVKDRIKHILAYSDTNTVPPKEKDKCTYCRYKQACKKLGDTTPKTLEELTQLLLDTESEKIGGIENGQSNS